MVDSAKIVCTDQTRNSGSLTWKLPDLVGKLLSSWKHGTLLDMAVSACLLSDEPTYSLTAVLLVVEE